MSSLDGRVAQFEMIHQPEINTHVETVRMLGRVDRLTRAAVALGVTHGCRVRDDGAALEFRWRFTDGQS